MRNSILLLLGFFLLIPFMNWAQIRVGDTLEMSSQGDMNYDTTLVFELESEEDNGHPMTIGLVLSGGGAKGLAHVGVLEVLEREGIFIDYIGGTSMGGLVGGLYAAGYTPAQLREICFELPWSKLLSDEEERRDLPLQEKANYDSYILKLPMIGFIPGLPKGLKEGQLIVNVLNKLTWEVNDIKDFSQLPTPFFCVATDLETGDTVLIDKGDLSMALRATMSIPSVFSPLEFQGRTVIDGGLVNNYPVDIMMAKGADYVIGVDVGAPLYKSDEINSVINILDQISSFHQQQRYHDNVSLTDLYIKPDISGLSAMSFDDVEGILDRGEAAAMKQIEQIRKLAAEINKNQKPRKRTFHLSTSDTIFVNKMSVEGLEKVGLKMVEGRLGINLPGVNSISNINAAIDRLYSSNFFEFINYKLIKNVEGYELKISVRENSNSLFNVGGRYDTDLGASLLLNVQLINKIFAGSRLDFSLKVGPTPAGGISYLVDRGRNLGFGGRIHYNSSFIKTYSGDYTSVLGTYYMSFTSMDLMLFSNYSNNATFMMGGTMEFLNITTEVSPIPINYSGTPFFNLYLKYILDSYNDLYFPTKGSRFNLQPTMITQKNAKTVFYVNVETSSVVNLHKNFSILPSAFLGASWGGIDNTGHFYVLGGAGMNHFMNMQSFVGLPFSARISNNLLYGRLDFRYQFFKKHYITIKTNVAAESEYFEELITKSHFTYGGGLSYSLNSLVGPIELGLNISNRHKVPSIFFNIGYFF